MDRFSISILGSTGSIGTSALDVLEGFAANGDEVSVSALTARTSVEELSAQVRRWQPALAVVADETLLPDLKQRLEGYDGKTELLGGPEAVNRAAEHEEAEIVLNALVGGCGLVPTVRALEKGKRMALANKEALVVGGTLVTELARIPSTDGRPRLMPVDSEHSALFQALGDHPDEEVERLILTASGGPFKETPVEEFGTITPRQALQHPTWNMGAKITIDSATLMNKGLEVIEAHWLFGLPVEKIGVVIHPESIVHSLVEFIDGNILAHFSVPDMRLPIQYALTYPHRKRMAVGERLGLEELSALKFESPDEDKFPSLELCRQAISTGGTMPAVLNGANEVAVASFLSGKMSFPEITVTIDRVMTEHRVVDEPDLEELIAAGTWATRMAGEIMAGRSGRET
jgi:1-deoxy-D-xylulose-5-phosphate reductoisomerase